MLCLLNVVISESLVTKATMSYLVTTYRRHNGSLASSVREVAELVFVNPHDDASVVRLTAGFALDVTERRPAAADYLLADSADPVADGVVRFELACRRRHLATLLCCQLA